MPTTPTAPTASETSIEFIRAITSLPGYASSIGTQVLRGGQGELVLRALRRTELEQFNGYFHGGVISGLADHAAGGAATTLLPPGRIAVTIDLHVNYLRPAQGDTIVAHARVIQSGGSISVVHVDVRTSSVEGAGDPCAIALVTLRSVPLPAEARQREAADGPLPAKDS